MTKSTYLKVAERDEAMIKLREILNPGDTVYAVLRHRSAGGMTRHIDLYKIAEGEPLCLSYWAGHALGLPVNVGNHEGIKIGGCGMDMGFELVYRLSGRLFPDGFACLGRDGAVCCPGNDHLNAPREEYQHHRNGGYALNHRWL
jgi:hypothetical protein